MQISVLNSIQILQKANLWGNIWGRFPLSNGFIIMMLKSLSVIRMFMLRPQNQNKLHLGKAINPKRTNLIVLIMRKQVANLWTFDGCFYISAEVSEAKERKRTNIFKINARPAVWVWRWNWTQLGKVVGNDSVF